MAQRVVQATPVSTAKVFMQAIEDNAVVANIGNNIPDYKLTLSDTGIENYVLIIGESERTANMGIYGYQRDTTPELEKQKSQLLLFRNAVTPAPVTIMAVPLAMTADTVSKRDPHNTAIMSLISPIKRDMTPTGLAARARAGRIIMSLPVLP
jgi:glucan phosphoethanolaminetransferase (alkaline phosphatase superfamily)